MNPAEWGMVCEAPVFEGCVDPYLSITQAEEAVWSVNPKAEIVKIWMGDTWPVCNRPRIKLMFQADGVRIVPLEPNPDADSIIEFSDGHMIIARTHEQSNGNPPPSFGKARRGTGAKDSRSSKRKTR